MLGWINDCIEKLVIEKFGLEAWHVVRSNSPSCKDIPDGGFLKLEHYHDQSTLELVAAVSDYSGLTGPQVVEVAGTYFVSYISQGGNTGEDTGYGNLLFCQGNTLKDWMSNINAIHEHLQTTFPKKMTIPEFWCEDNNNSDGTLTLYYCSSRGNILAPLAVGIVNEVAKVQFDLDITMDLVTTQGVNGARFTSWIISTKDPADLYKLRSKKGGDFRNECTTSSEGDDNDEPSIRPKVLKCPFSGMHLDAKDIPGIIVAPSPPSSSSTTTNHQHHGSSSNNFHHTAAHCFNKSASSTTTSHSTTSVSSTVTGDSPVSEGGGHHHDYHHRHHHHHHHQDNSSNHVWSPFSSKKHCSSPRRHRQQQLREKISLKRSQQQEATMFSSATSTNNQTSSSDEDDREVEDDDEFFDQQSYDATGRGGLSVAATHKLFPYHVVIDGEFNIIQVGPDLPRVLGTTESILYGYEIHEVFDFVKPKPAKWTHSWMRKLEDQEFVLECTLESPEPVDIVLKGTMVTIGPDEVMLILCPHANSLDELRSMKLTISDLPAHGAYRDALFLREHLSRQLNNALKMEKLSKTLQTEKELLESLIPVHAAEGLRKGKKVEPKLHNNVTMFFSDIVGFTSICKKITPWQVVGMLNELYGIMDYLAKKFHLFKVETIGDAYVCCSGLPESDSNNAINVANFAIAVSKLCSRVKSPVDGLPIQLRIGIHSGPCASGIVGVTNPRYCVFGDTVNTTSRHESTGEPGRVHCSLATMIELSQCANNNEFDLEPRGLVDMKGKGEMPTFWLTAKEENVHVNRRGLRRLEKEIEQRFPSPGTVIGEKNLRRDSSRRSLIAPAPDTTATNTVLEDQEDKKRTQHHQHHHYRQRHHHRTSTSGQNSTKTQDADVKRDYDHDNVIICNDTTNSNQTATTTIPTTSHDEKSVSIRTSCSGGATPTWKEMAMLLRRSRRGSTRKPGCLHHHHHHHQQQQQQQHKDHHQQYHHKSQQHDQSHQHYSEEQQSDDDYCLCSNCHHSDDDDESKIITDNKASLLKAIEQIKVLVVPNDSQNKPNDNYNFNNCINWNNDGTNGDCGVHAISCCEKT